MFGQMIPQEWIYEGSELIEAVSRLIYVAEQGQPFVLLQGPRGSGKSFLLSMTQTDCVGLGYTVVRMNVAALDRPSFLVHLAGGLSIVAAEGQSETTLMGLIRDEINGRAVCGQKVVILLDDLHLAADSPEQLLRFLAGVNQQTRGAVTVIGTSELAISATVSAMSELKVQLKAYSEESSMEFLTGKLKALGISAQQVDDEGANAIIDFGKGQPGRLSRVCEMLAVVLETDPATIIDSSLVATLSRETLLADVA